MSRPWCSAMADGVRIAVQITPNARKTEVVGETGDALRIKLQAPPVDGKANEALIRYLAERLAVPKSSVSIAHGLTGRKKLLEVRTAQLTVDAVTGILSQDA